MCKSPPSSSVSKAPRWDAFVFVYALFQATLSSLSLVIGARAGSAGAIARATLELSCVFALLPACRASRPVLGALDYGAGRLRVAVLAAFASSLALLVDALLRVLAAFDVFLATRTRTSIPPAPSLIFTQAFVCILALISFRSGAAVPNIAADSLTLARILGAGRHRRNSNVGELSLEDRARAPAPALCAVFLHALSSLFARIPDVALLMGNAPSSVCAALDVVTAALTAWLTLPLFKICVRVLMHATPAKLVAVVESRKEYISAIEGVIEEPVVHVWEETPGVYIGTVAVRVRRNVQTAVVLEKATSAFDGFLDDLTVQVEAVRDLPPRMAVPSPTNVRAEGAAFVRTAQT